MKPTRTPDESNPQLKGNPYSRVFPKTSLPRWLVSSSILLLASISSLLVYGLKGLKSSPRPMPDYPHHEQDGSLSAFRKSNPGTGADPTGSMRWALLSTIFALLSAGNLLYHAIRERRAASHGGEARSTSPVSLQDSVVGPVDRYFPELETEKISPNRSTGIRIYADPIVLSEQLSNQAVSQEGSQPDSFNHNTFTKWLDEINAWSPPEISIKNIRMGLLAIAGPLLAILLAYTAQSIFNVNTLDENGLNWDWLKAMPEITRLAWGVGFYALSMVLWFVAAPPVRIAELRRVFDPAVPPALRWNRIQILFLAASIFIYLVTILSYIVINENSTIRALWVIGMVFFILAQFLGFRSSRADQAASELSPRFHWWNWAILAVILVVAFFLRFSQLTSIPNDLHGDMASYGLVARAYLLGQETNIFENGWYDIPRMGFLPTIFSMKVFGDNLFGLQMTAVVGGLFSLLAVYLLIWRLFDSHRLAALTTSLVAINIVHIHFSRIAAYMDPWPFCYFALFFLIDGLKSRRSASLGLAGVLLGFGFEMYYSGRVIIFITGIFLVYLFFFRRVWISLNIRGLIYLAIGFLLVMGPSLVYDISNMSSFAERTRQVFLFTPEVMDHSLSKYAVSSSWDVVVTQIRLSLLMFNHSTDSSTQFGFAHPMFSFWVSPLLLLGFVVALRGWKHPGMVLILAWLGLIIVLGSILTVDAPFWPRLVGIIPAAAFLAALAMDQILNLGEKIGGTSWSFLPSVLMVFFLVFVGWENWNQYHSAVLANAHPEAIIGRYLASLPEDINACSLLNTPPLSVRETYFLAWPRNVMDFKPDAPDNELGQCPGPPLVWIISDEYMTRLGAIKARWPGGILQNHQYINFKFSSYLVGEGAVSNSNEATTILNNKPAAP